LGNTIQNARNIQVNPTLNLTGLYNKFGFIKRNSGASGKGAAGFFVGLLTSVKTVNGAFTQTKGTFLPGYMPKTNYLGIDAATGAPGWGFILGSQEDIRDRALRNGWLSTDTLQSQLYVNTLREDLSLTSTVEPIRDLRITLTANRNRTLNYSSNFRYSNERGGFENLSPYTTRDYNISFISLRTAFSDKNGSTTSGLYRQFMANRAVVSQRLGAQNGNSNAGNGAFADGYNEQAQDVLVAAFVAA